MEGRPPRPSKRPARAAAIQWQVIKFGGLIVAALIVFVQIVKLVKEATQSIAVTHFSRFAFYFISPLRSVNNHR